METISEADFLLVELRYTLAELDIQVGHADASERRWPLLRGTSIDDVLMELVQSEERYRGEYARLQGDERTKDDRQSAGDLRSDVRTQREHTIALLQRTECPWPDVILDLVKSQVAGDRRQMTRLAELRLLLFQHGGRQK